MHDEISKKEKIINDRIILSTFFGDSFPLYLQISDGEKRKHFNMIFVVIQLYDTYFCQGSWI
jgi:hypothetical protein